MNNLKAITFSYDDGVTQDVRIIELFNKYGLKSTFNINSLLLGKRDTLLQDGVLVSHNKIKLQDVKKIYFGHEIASHTLTHANLTNLSEKEIIKEVEEDRKRLSDIAGYNVVGMAYPCGEFNCDVIKTIKNNTGIKYARTTDSTHDFLFKKNLLKFNPTVYQHCEGDKMIELAEKFLKLKTDKPSVFYIWGHSYELDIFNTWEKFEEFLKLISGKKDIFYGTNKEVFEKFKLLK